MKELETKIHEYIEHLYKAKFTNRLEVNHSNGIFELILGLPVDDIPTTISLQTDDEEKFLEYVCNELKSRNYLRIKFLNVKRVEHGIHEKRRKGNKKD